MRLIIAFVLTVNLCLVYCDDNKHAFFLQRSPSQPPKPSPIVEQCLNTIIDDLEQCRQQAIVQWNITTKSPTHDICCAEWQLIDCDLSAAKQKCSSEEFDATQDFANQMVDYIENTQCSQYPKGSAQCYVEQLTDDMIDYQTERSRPPLPPATAVDCLNQLGRPVIRTCAFEARLKWNVTRRSPIRNKCCALWDDIDCLDSVVTIRCPSKEVADTESYFKQIESWAGNEICNASTYHSKNCSQSQDYYEIEVRQQNSEFKPYVPLSLPASRSNSEDDSNKVNVTYIYFALNYMMSVFPHLLHMMILLAVILITVVVVQCFVIVRQHKHNRIFAEILPKLQGYQKV